MRRREFIAIAGGAAVVWPLAARAQQGDRMHRLGILMAGVESDPQYQADVAVFREGLQKLGWVDGQNIRIEVRWAGFDAETMRRYAKELVGLQPDLILSNDTPTTATLLQQTQTIPIVFATVADPVGSGFVASFARPGGNATGFAVYEASLGGKWLELLKETVPSISRVVVIFNPATAPLPNITSNPSTTLRRTSGWRQKSHMFTTYPNSKPSLPQRHATRIVV
jgi:putative tryptophan/tyrosine transport system substrate-binding protein